MYRHSRTAALALMIDDVGDIVVTRVSLAASGEVAASRISAIVGLVPVPFPLYDDGVPDWP